VNNVKKLDWDKHTQQVYDYWLPKHGEGYAKQFLEFYKNRFEQYKKPLINHRLAWALLDDFYATKYQSGMRWFGCVGVGGSGKSTLVMNMARYLDPSFGLDRIKNSMFDWVELIKKIPINAMKSVVIDEPDDTHHPLSKEGKKLREVVGKARQHQLFCFFCATDLSDIPNYIFKKLSGIIFTPKLGQAMLFVNRSEDGKFVVQDIRNEYQNFKTYSIFYNYSKRGDVLRFPTYNITPFSNKEFREYENAKAKDYERSLNDFVNIGKGGGIKPELSKKDKIIILLEAGMPIKNIVKSQKTAEQYVGRIKKELLEKTNQPTEYNLYNTLDKVNKTKEGEGFD